ncbi:MAG: T9SS type A sorting domain-containing protein [Flavobacteriales bacterium]|nr:T9SS type A sorting domain-containing protein [Flavobacteriales bacterium]
MLKSTTFFLICSFFSVQLFAQCVPDESFVPIGANYGLSPDTLATAYVNQSYNQDLTFVLPLDTLVEIEGFGENLIAFEDYHITSISLPIGLSWECNNSQNNCHYDPTISQYGCVNLYGVPLEYGEFNVDVNVVATHELSWAVGTEEISFSLPLTILPNISANSGFAMTNFSGCAPLTVDFINNNPDLAAYSWDFGNGNVSNLENPSSQLYTEPGVYEVHYTAHSSIEPFYFLTSIQVSNASGWGQDAEDVFGDPDPYFYLFDEEGNQIYSSSVQVDNSFPVSWDLDNILLTNQSYSVQVWDQDGVFTGDDNLGSVSFDGYSSSSTLTNGDLVVEYTILEVQPTPFADVVDTIYVYDSPNQPSFSYDEENVILSLDSDSLDVSYQWYYINSPIPNANNTTHIPSNSGFYYVLATNDFGCSTPSQDEIIVVCDDFAPELELNSDTISYMQSSIFEYQWFYEGEQMLDQSSSYIIAEQEGTYSLLLLDQWGCKYNSNEVFFSLASLYDYNLNKLSVFPNPASNYLDVKIDDEQSFYLLELFDMQGRKVLSQQLWDVKNRLDIQHLERGTYMLKAYSKGQQLTKRIVLN